MSDPVADLLLELYKTYKATVFSNLFVGIVFGELILSIRRHFVSHTSCAGAYVVLYGTSLYILL
jgi:hypothetical protein